MPATDTDFSPEKETGGSVENSPQQKSFPSKSNDSFRELSREEDALLIRRAFDGPTQDAIAKKGSRELGVSPRQIVNWLQGQHDMPSWAVKAAKYYLRRLGATQ